MHATCPSCQGRVTVAPEHVGMALACPLCEHAFRVRGPAAAPPPPVVAPIVAPPRVAPAVAPPPPAVRRGAPPRRAPLPPPASARGAAPTGRAPQLRLKCPECEFRMPPGVRLCPECGTSYTAAKRQRDHAETDGAFDLEMKAIDKGVIGGILLIVVAGVWFYFGYQAGRIFFYPPILAFFGVVAIVNGLTDNRRAGSRRRPRRAPTRHHVSRRR